MNIRTIAVAALAAGALFSSAWAMDVREPTEVHVSTIGVDFAQPASVREFYGRLSAAARRACDSRMGKDLAAAMADRKCAAQALDRAVAEINKPTLLALHAEHGGRATRTVLASN